MPDDGNAERALERAPRPLLRLDQRRPEPGHGGGAQDRRDVRVHGVRAVKCVARPAGLNPQVADQRQEVVPDLHEVRRARHPVLRRRRACPGRASRFAPQDVARIDEVCWFFPELKFVTRHGCEPWTDLDGEADAQVAEPLLLDHRRSRRSTTRRTSSTSRTRAAPTRSSTRATSPPGLDLRPHLRGAARTCRSATTCGRSSCDENAHARLQARTSAPTLIGAARRHPGHRAAEHRAGAVRGDAALRHGRRGAAARPRDRRRDGLERRGRDRARRTR